MKTNLMKLAGLALLVNLAACGGGNTPVAAVPVVATAGVGSCTAAGTKLQTVTANLQNGAYLTLDLIAVNGGISAVGELNIPSMNQFAYAGANVGTQDTAFRSCVSSVAAGTLATAGSVDKDIVLTVQGSGVTVELGNFGYGPTSVRGAGVANIFGPVRFTFGTQPYSFWFPGGSGLAAGQWVAFVSY